MVLTWWPHAPTRELSARAATRLADIAVPPTAKPAHPGTSAAVLLVGRAERISSWAEYVVLAQTVCSLFSFYFLFSFSNLFYSNLNSNLNVNLHSN
jgi:small neutral amino acid transporter SnatA (MarC family)